MEINPQDTAAHIIRLAADPASPADGDVWYNTTTNTFRKRQNGIISDLDTTGAAGAPVDAGYLVGATNPDLTAERVVTDTATVTWDLTVGGQAKANVPDAGITYAKIQDVAAASRLLGRGSAAGAGDVQEITIGANLTLSGTELSATGGGSGLTHPQVMSRVALRY